MKIVYKAADIIEANIVAGMLSSRGIEAHVGGFYLQGGIGELAPLGNSSVSVADEHVEAAMVVISEYEQAEGSENERPTDDDGFFSA